MNPVLGVHDLSTEFKTTGGIVQAVNGISFSLNAGEMLAIVGESGSGKSVAMLSVMGLIPDISGASVRGDFLLDGKNLAEMKPAALRGIRGKDLAMVFQDPMTSLNPVMTIGRQIEEPLCLHLGLNRQAAQRRVVELLELVGIPDAERRARDYPHQFSGGMRQRVMIAMALSCNPKVLIADEPTTALDVTIQAQIAYLVKRLQSEIGMAVIWITHDLGLVASLADQVAVMYAGRIVEQSSVDELFAQPRHPYTLGLLRSVPRLDKADSEMLVEIKGVPPNPQNLPPGCPFAPRCSFAMADCSTTLPPLVQTDSPGHYSACFVWQDLKGATH